MTYPLFDMANTTTSAGIVFEARGKIHVERVLALGADRGSQDPVACVDFRGGLYVLAWPAASLGPRPHRGKNAPP